MKNNKKKYWLMILKKIWPVLVSLGGASVMLLAFFIPSLQDQWDRYQSRKVIEQYEEIGNDFFAEEHYKMAEEAYARAFELSDQKRLDIEVKRLSSKVNRINEDPAWGSNPPEDLEEADFQMLLHMQSGKEKRRDRLYTLNSYGIFLASKGDLNRAKDAFEEAIRLDPDEAHTYINLGNLLDQQLKFSDAERAYLKASVLDSLNARVHYNLGLLHLEQHSREKAIWEFRRALQLDPADSDAAHQLRFLNEVDKN